ncbi:MAG: enoyl-CoA hydratase-related protein [bacterium]
MTLTKNEVVLYQVDGGVARITLNRPEKRNALNDALVAELKASLAKANDNEAVRVIVIIGAGNDFCSGADLSALQRIATASVEENVADARSLVELFLLIRRVKVPVVAAVRGRALAGGCGLATACDIVLAARSARFGYPEVRVGFVPAIVMAILRRNVSEKRAFELVTLGAEISADEAERIGLVNKVLSEEGFDNEVENYVRRFEKVSRSAVSLSKSLLYQIDGLSFVDALQTGQDVNVAARMTEDCKEGIARFLKQD